MSTSTTRQPATSPSAAPHVAVPVNGWRARAWPRAASGRSLVVWLTLILSAGVRGEALPRCVKPETDGFGGTAVAVDAGITEADCDDGACVSGDCDNAIGKFEWADGSMYQGQWEDGDMCGVGVQKLADGSDYFGWFEGGKRHGRGVAGETTLAMKHPGWWVDGVAQSTPSSGPGESMKTVVAAMLEVVRAEPSSHVCDVYTVVQNAAIDVCTDLAVDQDCCLMYTIVLEDRVFAECWASGLNIPDLSSVTVSFCAGANLDVDSCVALVVSVTADDDLHLQHDIGQGVDLKAVSSWADRVLDLGGQFGDSACQLHWGCHCV